MISDFPSKVDGSIIHSDNIGSNSSDLFYIALYADYLCSFVSLPASLQCDERDGRYRPRQAASGNGWQRLIPGQHRVDLLSTTLISEMNMAAAEAASKGRTIAIWVLRVVLGLTLLAIGAAKLTGAAQTVQLFAAIGWGQWFRDLTGLLDVAGAVLLFVPRWTCYGAVLLACTVG